MPEFNYYGLTATEFSTRIDARTENGAYLSRGLLRFIYTAVLILHKILSELGRSRPNPTNFAT